MHIVEIMLLVMGMNVAFWLVALDRARSLKASGLRWRVIGIIRCAPLSSRCPRISP